MPIISKPRDLWTELCSSENLQKAYKKARKKKTLKPYVKEFEKNLSEKLQSLRTELLLHSYSPRPLITFIICDPKTRRISKSDFRDRIIHHAICIVIEPIFDKSFIYDSYANRIGKGTLNAIKRFDYFKRKASKNNTKNCYVLKADIRHYFQNVNHDILISIIKRKIKDKRIIWLIRKILSNYKSEKEKVGMPLGNLTSQFFANVYLNELDQFVKHNLKAKYYIRYVDDFVILDNSEKNLKTYQSEIDCFLKEKLKLELHPDKTKIFLYTRGIEFLGVKIFPFHKIIKKKNIKRFKFNFDSIKREYIQNKIDYDSIYDFMEGWTAYAKNANTYKLRNKILDEFNNTFSNEMSSKEIDKYMKLK